LAELLGKIQWSYEPVTEMAMGEERYSDTDNAESVWYGWPEGLKLDEPRIKAWKNPLECFLDVSSFDRTACAKFRDNSNRYFYDFIKPKTDRVSGRRNNYHNLDFIPISSAEIYNFLGILLFMGIYPKQGGYREYFRTTRATVRYKKQTQGANPATYSIALPGTECPDLRMKLRRFCQIRGCFHPENRYNGGGGDKCYQLRGLLKGLNLASSRYFHLPRELAFDEGGIGTRSRMCPVRMYNGNKPKKFHVSLFILAGSDNYVVHLSLIHISEPTRPY